MKKSKLCSWFLKEYHGGRMILLMLLFIIAWCIPMDAVVGCEKGWLLCISAFAPIMVAIIEAVITLIKGKSVESQNFGVLLFRSTGLVAVCCIVGSISFKKVAYPACLTLFVWLLEMASGYTQE